MQRIFHWKRIWVGLVISIGVRQNGLPLQLFHSSRRFLRIFGYRLPKANFLANRTISGSTSWHPAATPSWTNFKRNFDERGFSIVSASTGNERCLHAVRRFREWNEGRLSETKVKRSLSLSAQRRKCFVDVFVGTWYRQKEDTNLRRVCETSGIGTVLELGTRSRRYRSRQVGDTFTQQRRSFAYTAAVREPVVYSSSLRGACTNTAFCNGL